MKCKYQDGACIKQHGNCLPPANSGPLHLSDHRAPQSYLRVIFRGYPHPNHDPILHAGKGAGFHLVPHCYVDG